MPYILGPRDKSTLAHFAQSNVLLAFDYDGTLSPVAATPTQARMRAKTRRLLSAVAERYPCVVISGRTRADIAGRIDKIPFCHVAGNHGAEPWGESEASASLVREWTDQLAPLAVAHAGVVVEDKKYSVAVHYRQARHKRLALKAIAAAASRLKGARVMGGAEAINIVPRDAPHKGIALERARHLLVCDTVIYVGDDDTDEDAFGAGRSDRLLAIRVGAKRHSRARHWLKSQAEVDALLQTLLALRPPPHHRRPPVRAASQ